MFNIMNAPTQSTQVNKSTMIDHQSVSTDLDVSLYKTLQCAPSIVSKALQAAVHTAG